MLSFIKLKKEANLLDSKWFILKAFLAVLTAYAISHNNPILKLDIISVLFGLMLTLEPVTLTGIRNGLSQIYASALGAFSTAVIIYVLGNNIWTVALSMAFTLYVCLKINWRAVSPVAIFTSIYMTQYVQKTISGDPSILLTFRLRIFALGTGVLIAIVFNFIFSLFSYKSMMYKRIAFLSKIVIENLENTLVTVKNNSMEDALEVKRKLPDAFNNIDWVFSLFEDIKREYKFKSKVLGFSREDIERMGRIIMYFRTITHLNYDSVYTITDGGLLPAKSETTRNRIEAEINDVISEMASLKEVFDSRVIPGSFSIARSGDVRINDNSKVSLDDRYTRISHDMREMKNNISKIRQEILCIKDLDAERYSKSA